MGRRCSRAARLRDSRSALGRAARRRERGRHGLDAGRPLVRRHARQRPRQGRRLHGGLRPGELLRRGHEVSMARRPRGHALHERDRLHARLLRVRGALEASAHLVVPRRKVRHPRGGLLRARRDADAELRGRAGALTATPRKKLLVRAVRKPGSVPALPPVAIIPLGRPLLGGSCDLLGIESARATPARFPSRSQTGLAPGGVCRAPLVTEGAVRSYRTVSPLPTPRGAGGLFSVALSFESPRLAVSQHPALRSPDFPRRTPKKKGPAATTCPARARSDSIIARSGRAGTQPDVAASLAASSFMISSQ